MGVLPAIHAARRLAADRLPPEVVDYVDAGSWAEVTAGEAVAAWDRLRLRPRVLRDVSRVDTTCELLGARLEVPLLAAPTAHHGLLHQDAEVGTARGVAAAGGLTVLSARSSARIEAVAAAAGPWWYQVYVMADHSLTEGLVARAAAAGARALVLTGDTPVVGAKRRAPTVPVAADELYTNTGAHLPTGVRADPVAAAAAITQDPAIGMEAIAWLRDLSGLPVLVKGVLRGDEALACLQAGAAGIIVSNHGGRQLDQAVATAEVLAEVVDAVGGRAPVLVDGGVHDGISALLALALGAAAVLIGRPTLWALAAGGGPGVEALFSELGDDLRRAMALAGASRLADVDRSLVRPPGR